jgi:hypothetical protein
MKLIELKTWVNNLPEEFMDFSIVNGEVGIIDGEHMYRLDKPITTLLVDEVEKQIIILNDSQETEDLLTNQNG